MLKGRCHCGAVSYEMSSQTIHQALCHCEDCRRCAGAPMVAWAMVKEDDLKVTGTTKSYASSEHGRRHFCETCGTGLFYANEAVFPGMIDIQTATLDDPGQIVPGAQIQTAERIPWMTTIDQLPQFDRYPGPPG
ncbi:MAG TPA: GFA family protein [Phenylobacterium sp.]